MKRKAYLLILTLLVLLIGKVDAATLTQYLGNSCVRATVDAGQQVTITFTNQANYTFKNWSVESGNVTLDTTSSTTTFTMPATDVVIRAKYQEEPTVLSDVATVGAYVTYVPSSTSYTVPATVSGYTDNQTFNPSITTSWRILSNEDGNIEIISNNSIGTLTLGGEEGYVNVVQTLNDISYSYVNKEYAIGGRSVGYSLDDLYEEEITNYKVIDTKVYPLGIVSDFPYIDDQLDTSELSATGIDLGDEVIWLASRYLDEYDDTTRFFMIRWMSSGGYCDYDCMIDNSGGESSASYGVRPVVSLKSGLTVTGSGTSSDPYIISATNPSQYTVTYSANGGYGEMIPQSVSQGSSLTLTTNTYEHHNKIFKGWSTVATATTATYTNGQTITPTSDMTLYAVWGELLSSVATVGSYVTYKPSSTSYTVPTTVSGYTSNQTFNPSSTTSWRVFSNENGKVEIISTDSVGKLYLRGYSGYVDLVQTLNDMSISYVNPQYAISGRSLGYYDEKVVSSDGTLGDDMTEEQKANYKKLDTSNYSLNNGVSGFPYEDYQYKLDEGILSVHGGIYQSSGDIWLANRSIVIQGGSTVFRSVDISIVGYVSCGLLYSYAGTAYSVSNGVRPIVTLKSNLTVIGGSGTSSDPYIISATNPSQYTVTYSANGGYGEMIPQSVVQESSLALNTNAYEHHTKTFLGWSTSATATTATYTNGQTITPTEDMTLYAIWE